MARSLPSRKHAKPEPGLGEKTRAHVSARVPELPELDRLIHERIRLGIVSALATNDSLSFNDLKRVLKTTDGVSRVNMQPITDGLNSFEVYTHHEKDLRETLAQRVMKNGWNLRRLDLRRRKLEDHFIDVVMRDDPLIYRPGGGDSESIQDSSGQMAATG